MPSPSHLPCCLTLLVAASAARAEPPAPRPEVTVSWAALPDDIVRACGLAGLHGFLLERLMQAGFALVERVDRGGIELTLAAEDRVIHVIGRAAEAKEAAAVKLEKTCDSTILLTIGNEVVDVARRLAPARREGAASPAPTTAPPPSGVTATPSPRSPVFGIGPSLVVVGAGAPLLGARLEVAVAFGAWQLMVGLAGAGQRQDMLWFADMGGDVGLGHETSVGRLRLLVGGRAGVVRHLFRRQGTTGGHFDARVGPVAVLRLASSPLALNLHPHFRYGAVEHVSDGGTRRIGQWGSDLSLTWHVTF